jgi:hypothetical protein
MQILPFSTCSSDPQLTFQKYSSLIITRLQIQAWL